MANIKKGIKKVGTKIKNGGKRFWHWYCDEGGCFKVLIGAICFDAGLVVAGHGIKKRLDAAYDNGYHDGDQDCTADIVSGKRTGEVYINKENGLYAVIEYHPEMLSKERVEELAKELPDYRTEDGLSFGDLSTRLYNDQG